MEIQPTVYYIAAITGILILLVFVVNRALTKFDPLSEPKGLVLLVLMGVQMVENMVSSKTNESITRRLSPYIATVALYIFLSNISGLFSFDPPTSNYSVTLTLALITCVLIEKYAIEFNGVKNYIHGLFEPMAPFVIINIISKISTFASLSLRLFGNIISGSILMTIIYAMCASVSKLIPLVGQFNFLGVIIAPVLHFYFDLFSGAMQTYLFITLSIAFISKELPKRS